MYTYIIGISMGIAIVAITTWSFLAISGVISKYLLSYFRQYSQVLSKKELLILSILFSLAGAFGIGIVWILEQMLKFNSSDLLNSLGFVISIILTSIIVFTFLKFKNRLSKQIVYFILLTLLVTIASLELLVVFTHGAFIFILPFMFITSIAILYGQFEKID